MMRTLALIFAASLLSACGGSSAHVSAVPQPFVQGSYASLARMTPAQASKRFKYVIVIVQENRSFDNMFHDFPGANSRRHRAWATAKPTRCSRCPFEVAMTSCSITATRSSSKTTTTARWTASTT